MTAAILLMKALGGHWNSAEVIMVKPGDQTIINIVVFYLQHPIENLTGIIMVRKNMLMVREFLYFMDFRFYFYLVSFHGPLFFRRCYFCHILEIALLATYKD